MASAAIGATTQDAAEATFLSSLDEKGEGLVAAPAQEIFSVHFVEGEAPEVAMIRVSSNPARDETLREAKSQEDDVTAIADTEGNSLRIVDRKGGAPEGREERRVERKHAENNVREDRDNAPGGSVERGEDRQHAVNNVRIDRDSANKSPVCIGLQEDSENEEGGRYK